MALLCTHSPPGLHTCGKVSMVHRLSDAALRASKVCAGFWLGSACDAAEGADELATSSCEGSSEVCAAGPSWLGGPSAADDMRLCHCVVAPEEKCEVAGGLARGASAPGLLPALAASGRGTIEETRLCHWVVAPEGLRMEGALVSWGGLGGGSMMTLASGVMDETRLCHCVVAPEGVYRGAAGKGLAAGGGSGALRGDHSAPAGEGEGGGEAWPPCARCCSLSRMWAGGCRGLALSVGLRSSAVRSITRPPLPTRWMWALAR